VADHVRPSARAYRRGLDDRMRVSRLVHERTGGTVQRGPFRGMRLHADLPDTSAKVLGSYECELDEAVERLLAAAPEQVVNVGCSDGFYAIGCALRLPGIRALAFDSSEWMQELTRANAALNELGVEVAGTLDCAALERLVAAGRTLVVCDCEGCEFALLDPKSVPSLRSATLLVELHDIDGSPDELLARFAATHGVSLIESRPRDRDAYPELAGLSDHDRGLAVFERPEPQQWAVFEPA
jgi:hypothetical protein